MVLLDLVAAATCEVMNQSSFDRLFALLTTSVVIIGVIAGFWWLGSPNKQRQIKADQQRLTDIREIAVRLHQQAQQPQNRDQPLPASLSPTNRKRDPISGKTYEYQRIDSTHYQLCAKFSTDSHRDQLGNFPITDQVWQHPPGRHCFKLDVLEEPPQLQAASRINQGS